MPEVSADSAGAGASAAGGAGAIAAPIAAAALAFGSRIRPSPFFEATLRWGCKAYTTYNHFYMPAVYEGLQADYQHLISAVTLWDVAGERQVRIRGRDAAAFTQLLTPRDLSATAAGRCRYVLLTNAGGGVINDPVLLRVAEDEYWLSLADADILLWCRGLACGGGYAVEIDTPDISPLQLQGPRAAAVAAALFGEDIRALKYFHLRHETLDGIPLVISRTGWSGERGYEIYLCDGERGDELWERIMQAGAPFGIRPACPSPIRRMESGLLSYGADANADDTPFHLDMARLVNLDGGFDFIGREALRQVQRDGVTRRLTGVVIDGAPLQAPLVRWWTLTAEGGGGGGGGGEVGKVRSAVYSPTLKKNIGLAMINKPHDADGAPLLVQTEYGDTRRAAAAPLPFLSSKAA